MEPTLVVLACSAAAAACGALGALPLLGRTRLPGAWMGWANALAAGLMLGAAYSLVEAGFHHAPWVAASGAAAGIAFVWWTHHFAGTGDLDLNDLGSTGPEYGYKVLLVDTLHSSWEGVAIGVAMLLDLSFGLFVAAAFAVHNVPEGTVLCAVLRARGAKPGHAAGLAALADAGQPLFAVVTFAVGTAAPAAVPPMLGFAVGALIYLTLVELLPECYRQAGHTSVALVTSVAMGMVVLFGGLL